MGSPLRLVIDAPTEDAADIAWVALAADVEATEAALSRHRETSELVRLVRAIRSNPGGGPIAVSRRLRIALVAADRARRITDGRFDPRILADLERLGDGGVPLTDGTSVGGSGTTDGTSDGASGRRRPVTGPILSLERRRPAGSSGATPDTPPAGTGARLTLNEPVDLGGIGKGLAIRWGARAVERALPGVPFLVDAGGDIVVGGPLPGPLAPWHVGVEDPRGPESPLAVVDVRGAICTSSIARRRWTSPDGDAVHHLIDPSTGRPGGNGLLAVTVAGPDPAWAEVWSKALFLVGPRGIAETARGRGLAAWWVTVDGTLEMTPAARPITVWTPDLPRRP